jgi:hypothetical protein
VRVLSSTPPSERRTAIAGVALLLALPLMVALWTFAALWLGAPAAWMAVIVAADASLLLGLLGIRPGAGRVAAVLAFTVIGCAASLWVVAAGIVGPAFGLLPWESALRLGPVLFEVISAPWWTLGTAAWFAAALALSVWWNR